MRNVGDSHCSNISSFQNSCSRIQCHFVHHWQVDIIWEVFSTLMLFLFTVLWDAGVINKDVNSLPSPLCLPFLSQGSHGFIHLFKPAIKESSLKFHGLTHFQSEILMVALARKFDSDRCLHVSHKSDRLSKPIIGVCN